jgi:hypothetical protein
MIFSAFKRVIAPFKDTVMYAPIRIGFVAGLVAFMDHMLFDSLGHNWKMWGSMGMISGNSINSMEEIARNGET